MKKKVILFFSVFLIVMPLLLSSCSKKEKAITIEFWTTETQSDRVATIQVIVDTFQAMNPNITVNVVPIEENDIPAQIQTSSAAGTLPTILNVGAELVVAYASEGIMDVDANTKFINKFGKDNFYAGTLKLLETTEQEKYSAVPFHGWIEGIWYRSDWFEEAGLDPPTTWEAIEKAAKYFYKPQENKYGILVGTKAEVFSEQCFTPIAMSNNAGLFDKAGNLIFNSKEMKEALEYYVKLAQYNPPGPQTWRARDYYMQGKMAMFFYSTFIMDDLALQEVATGSLTGENFSDLAGADFDPELVNHTRLASIISHKSDAGYGVIVSLGICKQKDKAKTEAALKFLNYLYSPNAYITFLHMAPGGMNPVIKGIAAKDAFLNDPKGIYKHYGKEKLEEIIQGLDSIETFSIVEGNRIEAASVIFSKQIIPQMIYKITQENMDIDKAMSWAEDEMKKLVN